MPFAVGPGVLVPRPETELLVDVALAEARNHARPTILEVGTGSGCVAISTERELGGRSRVVATEVSPAALAFEHLNRDTLGVEVELILGSLASVVRTATIIQANLPYIPAAEIDALEPEVSRWEPRVALDGCVDGFALIRALIADCATRLRPALLALEVGYGQAAAVAAIGGEHGAKAELRKDLGGIDRVVCLRWP
jgi:release factor glutamine methyltransferase